MMFKCGTCSRGFARKDILARHSKSHNGKRHACSICDTTFVYKHDVRRHEKNVHKIMHQVVRKTATLYETENDVAVTTPTEPSTLYETENDVTVKTFTEPSTLYEMENIVTGNKPNKPVISEKNASSEISSHVLAESSKKVSSNKRKYSSVQRDWDSDDEDLTCAIAEAEYQRTIANRQGMIQLTSNIFVPDVPAGPSKEGLNLNGRLKTSRMSQVQTQGMVPTKAAFGGFCNEYFLKNFDLKTVCHKMFLQNSKKQIQEVLEKSLERGPIKYNIKVESTYEIPNTAVVEDRAFKTNSKPLLLEDDLNLMLEEDFNNILIEETEYAGKGSGFSLKSIDGILLTINKYRPLFGSSYIKLPDYIQRKGATINVQNMNDNKCFQYSILSKFIKVHPERLSEQYNNLIEKYNFSGLSFPVPLHDVKKFEKNNQNVSVNVYGLVKGFKTNKNRIKHIKVQNSNQLIIVPFKVCDKEFDEHFDLLLFGDVNGNQHYCLISDFSRFVRSQFSNSKNAMVFCKRCFKGYFDDLSGKNNLLEHKRLCYKNKPATPCMPEPGEKMKFENWGHSVRHPIVIYADFECILKKISPENQTKNTKTIQEHIPMSYGFYVQPSSDVPNELLEKYQIPTSIVVFRGEESSDKYEVSKHFMNALVSVSLKIERLLKTNVLLKMTEENFKNHKEVVEIGRCPLCKCTFTELNYAVKDHNHLNGVYRQTICNNCNLKCQQPKFVPCFFHNLSNYDSHFIVTQLGYDEKEIDVIPNSEEKFISFSKHISEKFSIRFVDTLRFMSSSLDNLATNLAKGDRKKFKATIKQFNMDKLDIVTRKGVYPYEYTDNWKKLDDSNLPEKKNFYSTLKESDISNEDYKHAQNVWNRFNCKTLGDYSDLYLRIDILLLTDIFENFRDLCLNTYDLDPSHYYTAPGMSFQCMLKFTGIELDLLTDYDMLLFCEAGVRGGITQAVKRYAKANNKTVPGYNPQKPDTWITYLDATNLYGWAMSQHLPLNGFKWYDGDHSVSTINDMLDKMSNESSTGMFLEVDVSYPHTLHDIHKDLPYLAEKGVPIGSKIPKLMTTLNPKTNYIVHYIALKQALKAGLKLEKVHKILLFNQKPWLASYIKLNTNMRKLATNDFEKNFFKLMNNSVFGKTMENVRKRMSMELVSSDIRYTKLVNKPNFKSSTIYNENLSAVHLNSEKHNFNKPMYIGLSILEISKTLMYSFHYEVMSQHYGEKIELLYMDTDSLIYLIQTDDFYDDLLNKQGLLEQFDTSNFPPEHPCYRTERKKIPGTFTDETGSKSIWEQVALRAKTYGYSLVGEETIKAKGVSKAVVKNHLTIDDYKNCLFEGMPQTNLPESYSAYRVMTSFRSYKHEVKTISTRKLALNRYDDKRFVLENRIDTLPWGHYKIDKLIDEEKP